MRRVSLKEETINSEEGKKDSGFDILTIHLASTVKRSPRFTALLQECMVEAYEGLSPAIIEGWRDRIMMRLERDSEADGHRVRIGEAYDAFNRKR
jgi:hypothetical protein